MKPGIISTEFWSTILTFVMIALNYERGWGMEPSAIVSIVGANISYVGGRTYIKSKNGKDS